MIELRIKEVARTYTCDVAGCRNKTHYLITKRDDVASHPLHLCPSCITGIAGLLTEKQAGAKDVEIHVPETKENAAVVDAVKEAPAPKKRKKEAE